MNSLNQERIDELKQKVLELEMQRMDLLLKRRKISASEFRQFIPKINKLADDIYHLQERIQMLKDPDFSNQLIDIYLDEYNSDDEESNYYITISGDYKRIGHVRVTWKSFLPTLGNIGYELDENYRGHHYTLQALELLKDFFIKKGLTKPIFTAFPDNIASIKTIEGFGGKLITPASTEQSYNTYEANLLENEQIKKH